LFLVSAAVAVVAIASGLELLRAGGVFRHVEYDFTGTCSAVALPGGARDLRVDQERGLAYLTVLDRDSGNGTVMLMDLNLAEPAPRAAMSRDPAHFHPLGLSLLKLPGRPVLLFAVSTGTDGVASVEIAEQDMNGAFIPRESVRHPAFGNASLVLATAPGRFYVVDHHPPEGRMRQWESLLTKTGRDSIVLHDAGKVSVVAKDLAWVSGLAQSADGSRLYVAEALTQQLRVYRAGDDELTLERVIALGTSPGRLDVDADDVIWMSAHPRLLRYFAALDDGRVTAPTQVMRLDPRRPDAKPVQVFADDGARISNGTAFARWRNMLLIADHGNGAPSDHKVLICQLSR
jgi:sugar lactone lactonase YvrE